MPSLGGARRTLRELRSVVILVWGGLLHQPAHQRHAAPLLHRPHPQPQGGQVATAGTLARVVAKARSQHVNSQRCHSSVSHLPPPMLTSSRS